jgi:hypothetical protein
MVGSEIDLEWDRRTYFSKYWPHELFEDVLLKLRYYLTDEFGWALIGVFE